MDILLLLALSVTPGIFLVYRYFSKDIYKKEPWAVIWKSFFWGAATLIPAGILETSIEIPEKDSFLGMILENFLLVALTEELCKFLVIRFYAYRDSHFDEVMDGIVYGVAAASGFATFENIFYVTEHGMAVGMIRAVLSVPLHVFTGAILGYWLAKSKFQNTSPWFANLTSLSLVVMAHGFFDFVLSYDTGSYFYLSLIPVAMLGWLVKRYVAEALAYDVMYIHNQETVADNLDVSSSVESEKMSSGAVSYSRKIIHVALNFLAIICFLTAGFFMLGFVLTYMEKGEELWTLTIPLTPLLLGLFFVSKARKVKAELIDG